MSWPTWWLNTIFILVLGAVWIAAHLQMLFDSLPECLKYLTVLAAVLVLIARRQERKNPPVRDTGDVESSSP